MTENGPILPLSDIRAGSARQPVAVVSDPPHPSAQPEAAGREQDDPAFGQQLPERGRDRLPVRLLSRRGAHGIPKLPGCRHRPGDPQDLLNDLRLAFRPAVLPRVEPRGLLSRWRRLSRDRSRQDRGRGWWSGWGYRSGRDQLRRGCGNRLPSVPRVIRPSSPMGTNGATGNNRRG